MEFFNRKEEVLEIQLTQEGKRLLAKGEFKPHYYEFFDDDILYDTNSAEFDELQNESVPRIKETPRIKTQNIAYGVETDFNKLKKQKEEKQQESQNSAKQKNPKNFLYNKNHDPLKYALGLGDFSNNNAPAFNLKLFSGLITGSSTTYSPEPDYYEYIPQLTFTSSYVYEARADVNNYENLASNIDNNIIYKSMIFADDTYYVIREQNNIYGVLQELNSTFDKENFDIEVFEVEAVDGQKENLKNLYFNQNVKSLETLSIKEAESNPEVLNKSTDVEWYFSVMDDKEIEEEKETTGLVPFEPYSDSEAANSQEPC